MQANALHGPVHGARIGSKLPPLPPRPEVSPEVALPSDGVQLSRPPAPAAEDPVAAVSAPVVAAPAAPPPPPPPAVLTMDGQQFFLGGGATPATPPQASSAPKTIAEIRAQSDREIAEIMNGIARSNFESSQRVLDSMRGLSSQTAAPAPAPPAPSLSSSQKSQMQQLIKKGVNADFARSLVQSNDQFKIRLFLR